MIEEYGKKGFEVLCVTAEPKAPTEKFIEDTKLTASVALLSVLFWAWVLGPIGAILALPLTIFAKALLVDAHPESRWVGALLGGEHADEQPVEQLAEEAVEAPPREGA